MARKQIGLWAGHGKGRRPVIPFSSKEKAKTFVKKIKKAGYKEVRTAKHRAGGKGTQLYFVSAKRRM